MWRMTRDVRTECRRLTTLVFGSVLWPPFRSCLCDVTDPHQSDKRLTEVRLRAIARLHAYLMSYRRRCQ